MNYCYWNDEKLHLFDSESHYSIAFIEQHKTDRTWDVHLFSGNPYSGMEYYAFYMDLIEAQQAIEIFVNKKGWRIIGQKLIPFT